MCLEKTRAPGFLIPDLTKPAPLEGYDCLEGRSLLLGYYTDYDTGVSSRAYGVFYMSNMVYFT